MLNITNIKCYAIIFVFLWHRRHSTSRYLHASLLWFPPHAWTFVQLGVLRRLSTWLSLHLMCWLREVDGWVWISPTLRCWCFSHECLWMLSLSRSLTNWSRKGSLSALPKLHSSVKRSGLVTYDDTDPSSSWNTCVLKITTSEASSIPRVPRMSLTRDGQEKPTTSKFGECRSFLSREESLFF